MTIQEAINSGKKFKRSSNNSEWAWFCEVELNENVRHEVEISFEDILAEDWIVEDANS